MTQRPKKKDGRRLCGKNQIERINCPISALDVFTNLAVGSELTNGSL
jgi:hypothetical protein